MSTNDSIHVIVSQSLDDGPLIKTQQKYEVTSYRWLVLAFFAGCLMNTSVVTISLSPISSQVADAYGVSDITVNMCSVTPCLWFIPMTILSSKMYAVMPRNYPMILAAVLQLSGSWFRLLTAFTGSFWPVLLGTAVN